MSYSSQEVRMGHATQLNKLHYFTAAQLRVHHFKFFITFILNIYKILVTF